MYVELSLRQYFIIASIKRSISCKTLHLTVGKEKKKKRKERNLSLPFDEAPVQAVNENVTMITSNFYKCIFSSLRPRSLPRVLKTHPYSMIIIEASEVSNLRIFHLNHCHAVDSVTRSNQHVQ